MPRLPSQDLADLIFSGKMDPVDDQRWNETGADSPDEYAYWVERACGVACSFIIHNPSGRSQALQVGATIPSTLFEQGCAGRVIVAGIG
jgi:hypothetical protein